MDSVQRKFKVSAITDTGSRAKEVVLDQVTLAPDWPEDDDRWDAHFAELDSLFLERMVIETSMAVEHGEELILSLSRVVRCERE